MLVGLILMSGFFSATETAFSSLNKIRLKNMANNGNERAQTTLNLTENYSSLISTILIGNNIVNIAGASLATILFIDLIGQELGVSISTVVMTLAVLIFGEITPKNIAKEMPEQYAIAVTPIMSMLVFLMTPLNYLFDLWKKLITLVFNIKSDDSVTSEELVTMVEEVQNDGGLNEHQSDLIVAAIEFNDLEVRDILTPRVDVIAISEDTDFEEIESLFRINGFSRIPVYRKTIDNIIGIIHEKDFYYLYYRDQVKSIEPIIKEVQLTSASVKISGLLRQLQSNKTHMAVVLDEYGGTAGIITMEDILEELVGEIYDEHDEIEEYFKPIDDTTFLVECDVDLDDMFEFFKLDLEEEFDFVTASGWIIHMMDKIPTVGESFEYKDYQFIITDSDLRKVIQIKVVKETQENQENQEK